MVAFACTAINAQLVTSSSFKKEKSKTVWYGKVGMTFANVSADGESADNLLVTMSALLLTAPWAIAACFGEWGLPSVPKVTR